MRKKMMTAGIFLGVMIMLTPVFGFQYPDTEAKQAVSTVADEAPARAQYFVSGNGDCGGRTPCYGKIQDAIDEAPQRNGHSGPAGRL